MPRLQWFIEYRFVAPGYVHPEGYRVELVDEPQEIIDFMAKRQESFAAAFERRAAQCEHLGHQPFEQEVRGYREDGLPTYVRIPACSIDPKTGVPFCRTRAQRCHDCTRTAERTVLVRVHIPVNGSVNGFN